MRHATSKRLAAVLLAAWIACLPSAAVADENSARNAGAAWLIKQQRGDGSWASAGGDLEVQATSSAITALSNAGLSKSPSLRAASAWLSNADADSIDSIARKVASLSSVGMAGTAQREADRLYGLRTPWGKATWGGYGGTGIDLIDTSLGLAALRLGDASYTGPLKMDAVWNAYCYLVDSRIDVAAGQIAWSATAAPPVAGRVQGRASIVATAMVHDELRRIRQRPESGFNSLTCPPVSIDAVLADSQAWLLNQRNSDNGFGEFRADGSKGLSSVLVTALVYRAIANQTSAPSQLADVQTWLLNQQQLNGSWRNDPLVTATVMAALPPAAGAHLDDADRDGITNVVELQLGSNQNAADARKQLAAPTRAVAGETISAFTTTALRDATYGYSLGGNGSYVLAAGSLPPGLVLNPTTGQISGTPTVAGSYSFSFQSGNYRAIGVIVVAVAVGDSDGDGMPDAWEIRWGLNPFDPQDAAQDPDGDGLTNLQEYQRGTNPFDPDTDKDGMSDGAEVAVGRNPRFDERLLPLIHALAID